MQGSTPQVVVSGAKEARDVFVRQGAHTQDRPPSRFLLLMRDGYFPSGMSGPKWKTARRMWQAVLNPSAARKYVPYQELETEQLLYDILDDPTDWVDHLERFTNSIGMLMVNGYRVASSKDPVVKETLEDIYEVSRMRVRGLPLDIWPFLWKLPIRLLPIYKVALQSANQHRDFIWKHYLTVKQKIARGVGIPSFSQAIQEKLNTGWNDVSEIEGAEISHHLLSGATDTIVSTLLACIAALCLHPEVQHRAQEGITLQHELCRS